MPGHAVRAFVMAGQGEVLVEVGGVEDADASVATGHRDERGIRIHREAAQLFIGERDLALQ